jgi:hypothetical protein
LPAGVRLHLVDALADQDFGSLVGRIEAVPTVQFRVLETYKYNTYKRLLGPHRPHAVTGKPHNEGIAPHHFHYCYFHVS